MIHAGSINVHGLNGETKVEYGHSSGRYTSKHWLTLDGLVVLFADKTGIESEDNLIGFLDQLHAIRNALLQDRADRATIEGGPVHAG